MLTLYNQPIKQRLLLGTASYPSLSVMQQAIQVSQAEIITVSLRRQLAGQRKENDFWQCIQQLNCRLLPNTAGCHNAQDAIATAEMAREIFQTHWIKLEVIGDDYSLQPDPFELIKAAEQLTKRGFQVFPYCTDDFILCQRLLDCGCEVLMPWAAPIGSGQGLINPYALQLLRSRLPDIPLIIDAGIGAPAHAAQAMEMGFDAVLLNSAVARAKQPVAMAEAFALAIRAGRLAYQAGIIPAHSNAQASTPVLDTPFWQQSE